MIVLHLTNSMNKEVYVVLASVVAFTPHHEGGSIISFVDDRDDLWVSQTCQQILAAIPEPK